MGTFSEAAITGWPSASLHENGSNRLVKLKFTEYKAK